MMCLPFLKLVVIETSQSGVKCHIQSVKTLWHAEGKSCIMKTACSANDGLVQSTSAPLSACNDLI